MNRTKRTLMLLAIALITGYIAYWFFPRLIEAVNEFKINSSIIRQIGVAGVILLEYFLISICLISFTGMFFKKLKPIGELGLYSTCIIIVPISAMVYSLIFYFMLLEKVTFTFMVFYIIHICLTFGFFFGLLAELQEPTKKESE